MTVFTDLALWQQRRRQDIVSQQSLGFVPTMGALHDGHLSLVRRSVAENDGTLVSIFVNPTQFNDPNDLTLYPRPLAHDLALLESAGCDYVLCPTPEQMYPDRFTYRVIEREQSHVLEGEHRPHHFEGVLTVVLKLLQIASAERAYFGEKDWQQSELVRGMATAFFLSTDIVACPTIRAASGLALSSRNARLDASQLERAALFQRVLRTAATPVAARGLLEDAGFVVDYVADVDTRRLGAVHLDGVRLIDNVSLETRV